LTHLPIDAKVLTTAIMVLVMPYLSDPQRVLEEVHRATKPRGRLIVLDMLPHDREEYRDELGHSWLGFSRDQVEQWLLATGWSLERWVLIPPDPEAKGTQTFVATAVRR
jgi:ArsR family transcriptional regulator